MVLEKQPDISVFWFLEYAASNVGQNKIIKLNSPSFGF